MEKEGNGNDGVGEVKGDGGRERMWGRREGEKGEKDG